MRLTDEEAEARQPGQSHRKKKSKIKVFLITFLLLLILGGGGFAVWHFILTPETEGSTEAPRAPAFASPPMDFTVNLADLEQRRYLRATDQMGYSQRRLTKDLESRVPEIRDLIIQIFRSKTVEEINTPQGAGQLRASLKDELNMRLQAGEIEEIYFTEFVIQ